MTPRAASQLTDNLDNEDDMEDDIRSIRSIMEKEDESEDDIRSIRSGTPSPDREILTPQRLHILAYPPLYNSSPWRRAFDFARKVAVFYQLDDFASTWPKVTRCLRLTEVSEVGIKAELLIRALQKKPLHQLWIPYFLDDGFIVRGWKDVSTLTDFLEYCNLDNVREQEAAWSTVHQSPEGNWIDQDKLAASLPNVHLLPVVAKGTADSNVGANASKTDVSTDLYPNRVPVMNADEPLQHLSLHPPVAYPIDNAPNTNGSSLVLAEMSRMNQVLPTPAHKVIVQQKTSDGKIVSFMARINTVVPLTDAEKIVHETNGSDSGRAVISNEDTGKKSERQRMREPTLRLITPRSEKAKAKLPITEDAFANSGVMDTQEASEGTSDVESTPVPEEKAPRTRGQKRTMQEALSKNLLKQKDDHPKNKEKKGPRQRKLTVADQAPNKDKTSGGGMMIKAELYEKNTNSSIGVKKEKQPVSKKRRAIFVKALSIIIRKRMAYCSEEDLAKLNHEYIRGKEGKLVLYLDLMRFWDCHELKGPECRNFQMCVEAALRIVYPKHDVSTGKEKNLYVWSRKGYFMKSLYWKKYDASPMIARVPASLRHDESCYYVDKNLYFLDDSNMKKVHCIRLGKCFCVNKSGKSCQENCVSRATFYECDECNPGCQNQRIQNRQFVNESKLEKFKTEKKGFGVKTKTKLNKGEFVLEYVGEIITQDDYDNRRNTLYQNVNGFYGMVLVPGIVIDATRIGNVSRFINHACTPNCRVEKWIVSQKMRMIIVAAKEIDAYEELTYAYCCGFEGNKEKCSCGSVDCRGSFK